MKVSVKMKLDKETKRTYRYKEEEENYKLGTIYIQKSIVGKTPPEFVTVTVEEAK